MEQIELYTSDGEMAINRCDFSYKSQFVQCETRSGNFHNSSDGRWCIGVRFTDEQRSPFRFQQDKHIEISSNPLSERVRDHNITYFAIRHNIRMGGRMFIERCFEL